MVARSTYYTYYYLPAYYRYVAPYYAYTAPLYSQYYRYIPPYYAYTAPYSYLAISAYYYIVQNEFHTHEFMTGAYVISTWNRKYVCSVLGDAQWTDLKGWVSKDFAQNLENGAQIYHSSWGSGIVYQTHEYAPITVDFSTGKSIYFARGYSRYTTVGWATKSTITIPAYYAYTAPKYYYNSVIIRGAYYAYTPPIYVYTAAIRTNPLHYRYSEV